MTTEIHDALAKVKNDFGSEELTELLDGYQSFLCAEYRPEVSSKLQQVLDKLDDEDRIAIIDELDRYWVFILSQHLKSIQAE